MTYTIVIETVDAQDTPFTYPLAMAQTFTPETAFATFDGTFASSPFLACMSFLAPDGKRFMRVFPTTPVEAGDVADVTFAPFPGGIAQQSTGQGLPAWENIDADLSISNGSLLSTISFSSWAMVQPGAGTFSRFARLTLVLDDPGTPADGYHITGIPGADSEFPDWPVGLLRGLAYTGGFGSWVLPGTDAVIDGGGNVVFTQGVTPSFGSGDILFDGFGVYPTLGAP